MGNGLVKYNGELYMVTRIKDDKANLAHPNGGKAIHKDVPMHDLYVAGGKKERKKVERLSDKRPIDPPWRNLIVFM